MQPLPLLDQRDGPRDECGVFGIYGPEHDVSRLAYFALYALQHRGQESAGHRRRRPRRPHHDPARPGPRQPGLQRARPAHAGRRPGDRPRPLLDHRLERVGELAARPPLGGRRRQPPRDRARPQRQPRSTPSSCTPSCASTGVGFRSTSDSEIIAALLATHAADDARGRDRRRHAAPAGRVLDRRHDATTASSPSATRPACARSSLGQLGDRYCVACESCALDIIGAKLLRDVQPGEIVSISEHGHPARAWASRARARRSASSSTSTSRGPTRAWAASRCRPRAGGWARSSPARRRRPAPTSSSPCRTPATPPPAATRAASGLPTDDGFVKNRYVARTFIQPGQELRKHGLRLKFNPLPEIVGGKSLVVVDDSIVRGNTTRQIVQMLRDAGAREVHMRISAPPIKHPCHYGIDMSTREEMIAHGRTVDEVAAELGCDSLAYLSLDGVYEAISGSRDEHCDACFSGEYPLASWPRATASSRSSCRSSTPSRGPRRARARRHASQLRVLRALPRATRRGGRLGRSVRRSSPARAGPLAAQRRRSTTTRPTSCRARSATRARSTPTAGIRAWTVWVRPGDDDARRRRSRRRATCSTASRC